MDDINKKSILDVLLLTGILAIGSLAVLYLYIHRIIMPGQRNFGKVLGKEYKKTRSKRNNNVMSSNNSSVSIEISSAEMD